MKIFILLGAAIILAVPLSETDQVLAQQTNHSLRITEIQRTIIIKSALRRKLTENKASRLQRGVTILLDDNLKPDMLPRVRGLRYTLVDPSQIQAKIKAEEEVSYLAVSKFEVRQSKVIVWVSDNWDNTDCAGSITTVYEYRIEGGKWKGKSKYGIGEAGVKAPKTKAP